MIDLSLPLKIAVVEHISQDEGVTSLVPTERIYGMSVPAKTAWPFIRLGVITALPFEATCWQGIDARVTWHAFAETTAEYAGEDQAMRIASAISSALQNFKPDGLGIVSRRLLQTYTIRDEPEADRWHSIVDYQLTVQTST